MSSTLKLWDSALLARPEHPVLVEIPPEEPFDRLARIAAGLLDAPIALVTLVDGQRHSIEGLAGLEEPWSSLRELSFAYVLSREVVAKGEAIVVADASGRDLVHGIPGVVACVGVPLRAADGGVVGSFCVLDREVREWTEADLGTLCDLAANAATELRARSSRAR